MFQHPKFKLDIFYVSFMWSVEEKECLRAGVMLI